MSSGYVFDLGEMPARTGDRARFVERAKITLAEALRSNLDHFPLRSAVGLTIFYVHRSNSGDLDNMFRTLLPIVIDVLAPPIEDRHPWIAAELLAELSDRKFAVSPGQTGVQFIEAVSLAMDRDPEFPPGTLMLVLSNGMRHESWWNTAESYMDKQARSDYREPY